MEQAKSKQHAGSKRLLFAFMIAMAGLLFGLALLQGPETASADHNEFPNEQFCANVLEFIGAVCPDEIHGAFHGSDFVNSDELGPSCFLNTDQFAPYLEPGGFLLGFNDDVRMVVAPNGNTNITCRIQVPPELVVEPITSTLIVENPICFGPLGPTEKTVIKLNPAGIAQMTCHFQYGK